jgi:predicted  nucleic acid-binding Zn-ribbon protein
MKQSNNTKEILDKRKTKLLTDLKKVRDRLGELNHDLRKPGLFSARKYEKLLDEYNALQIKSKNMEDSLYEEFRMYGRQIDNGLKMLE